MFLNREKQKCFMNESLVLLPSRCHLLNMRSTLSLSFYHVYAGLTYEKIFMWEEISDYLKSEKLHRPRISNTVGYNGKLKIKSLLYILFDLFTTWHVPSFTLELFDFWVFLNLLFLYKVYCLNVIYSCMYLCYIFVCNLLSGHCLFHWGLSK